jgi:hypothetical protein
VLEKKYNCVKVLDGRERGTWVELADIKRTIREIADEYKLKSVYVDSYYADREGLDEDALKDIGLTVEIKDVPDYTEELHLRQRLGMDFMEHFGVPTYVFEADHIFSMGCHEDREVKIYG